MKDALRTRLEFIWAKLAGRDVDIDTLTPNAPTNMVEKLMLETADRIADASEGSSGGGGGAFVIHAELLLDDQNNATIIVEETPESIFEAVEAGQWVFIDMQGQDNNHDYLYLTNYYPGETAAETALIFKGVTEFLTQGNSVHLYRSIVEYDLALYGGWKASTNEAIIS